LRLRDTSAPTLCPKYPERMRVKERKKGASLPRSVKSRVNNILCGCRSMAPAGPVVLSSAASVGRFPARFFLAPYLAVRCGITPQKKVPSYFIRVRPGRQGHHVVRTGSLRVSSQSLNRRLPVHLMQYNHLLACYCCHLWRLVESLLLDQGKSQTQQPVKRSPHNLPAVEGISMHRALP